MCEEEKLAHQLAARLGARVVDRRSVHASAGARAVRVSCIWYETAPDTLALRMSPGNARASMGPMVRPCVGAEYYVELHDGDLTVAVDRTPEVEQVVACTRAWLAGCALEQVERETPFLRALLRRARTFIATLEPGLRHSIGGDPSYEVWVYGEGRSCKLLDRTCAFYLGQAQVAFGTPAAPAAAVSAWLVGRVPIAELAEFDVALERHAEVIEHDPARWHWLHLMERVADPGDVLAPLRELVERLAERPAVAAFYSFSSLSRLCFTASSHCPWVCRGLPVVWRDGDRYIIHTYVDVGIAPTICDLERTVSTIEARLASSGVQPFFGSAAHHELAPLGEALRRRGSTLRPTLVQRDEWFHLEVARGDRRCEASSWSVVQGGHRIAVDSLDAAAAVICDLLQ